VLVGAEACARDLGRKQQWDKWVRGCSELEFVQIARVELELGKVEMARASVAVRFNLCSVNQLRPRCGTCYFAPNICSANAPATSGTLLPPVVTRYPTKVVVAPPRLRGKGADGTGIQRDPRYPANSREITGKISVTPNFLQHAIDTTGGAASSSK
jgi:hypothetical protein